MVEGVATGLDEGKVFALFGVIWYIVLDEASLFTLHLIPNLEDSNVLQAI